MTASLAAPAAFSQGKPKPNHNKKDEQRENQRVREAQQALDQAQDKHKEAQRNLTQAGKDLDKAEAAKRQAIDKAQQLRKQLQEQEELRLELPQLLQEQGSAQKSFDAVAEPLLAALRVTQPYLAALADAKRAHDELQKAKGAIKDPMPKANPAVSALVKRTLKPSELETSALEADAAAQSARQKLSLVQAKIKAARDKAASAVENNPALRDALKDLDQKNDELDKAQSELERSRGRLAAAAAKVEQERKQVARAVAADRRDDNKNKPKKK
jgi:chromosome segregation ATPase